MKIQKREKALVELREILNKEGIRGEGGEPMDSEYAMEAASNLIRRLIRQADRLAWRLEVVQLTVKQYEIMKETK